MLATDRTDEEWDDARRSMVRRQLEARGIRDPRVMSVMGRVPRHEFVPDSVRDRAYDDAPLPIGRGQTISQPYMVALMTEALGPRDGARILEVGTGSGYQAAILAELGCEVWTVERDPVLAKDSLQRLRRLGWDRVRVRQGDGSLGWPEGAPFQGIVVTAGGPRVPPSLKQQLDARGGVLVIPVGAAAYQELWRVVRIGETWSDENLGGCRFVPLVGEEGW